MKKSILVYLLVILLGCGKKEVPAPAPPPPAQDNRTEAPAPAPPPPPLAQESETLQGVVLAENVQVTCQDQIMKMQDSSGRELKKFSVETSNPYRIYISNNKLMAYYPNQNNKVIAMNGANLIRKNDNKEGYLNYVFEKYQSDGSYESITLGRKPKEKTILIISVSMDKNLPDSNLVYTGDCE